MSLPIGVVSLKSNHNNKYLRYQAKGGQYHGFLQASGEQMLSPYTKFVVEEAKSAPGLVHIRCCYNNKYLVRKSPEEEWIVVEANEVEENQSKESCTLFKLNSIPGEGHDQFIRVQHVKSGRSLYGGSDYASLPNDNLSDVYRAILWDSVPILPRNVAFKADNGKYLILAFHYILSADGSDKGSPDAAHEITTIDDHVIIKKSDGIMNTNLYWKYFPDSSEILLLEPVSVDELNTRFHVIMIDANVIALKSLASNLFCARRDGTTAIYADSSTITELAKFAVEETVLLRTIYEVKYRIEDARIYNLGDMVFVTNTFDNKTDVEDSFQLIKSYTDTKTTTWSSTVSLKLGVETTITTGIPVIAEGKIEISAEFKADYEWGATTTTSETLQVNYPINVPPMKRVKATFLATTGRCDIPFSYVQKDLYYDGQEVEKTLEDGIYTGANYYDFRTTVEQFPLPPDELLPTLAQEEASV